MRVLRAIETAAQIVFLCFVLWEIRLTAQESLELKTEYRLATMEANVRSINERLGRIETLGYGVVGASMLQMFDLFVTRRNAKRAA